MYQPSEPTIRSLKYELVQLAIIMRLQSDWIEIVLKNVAWTNLEQSIRSCPSVSVLECQCKGLLLITFCFPADGGDSRLTGVQAGIIVDSLWKVRETSKSISSQHKALHSAVGKVGKTIDQVRCY